MSFEINFDSIVGPTHNYSGLSWGNIASSDNKLSESNPKAAALQGLEKMKYLADLGVPQAILPPQERPHLPTLRALGFRGTDEDILAKILQKEPELLLAVSSAASMWAANAATVSPSTDSLDQKVHITPANLSSKFHRSIETPMTAKILKTIFANPIYFVHHDPLPSGIYFSDEGAANHSRFCGKYEQPGVEFFLFGRNSLKENIVVPKVFPARQTFEASSTIARLHQLNPQRVVIAQQNPKAIDAGVFHNDVIAVGNRNVLLYHELAFLTSDNIIKEIDEKVRETCDAEMHFIKVEEKRVSLKEAVETYLFNSQIVTTADHKAILIAPSECQANLNVRTFIEELERDPLSPIGGVHYINLRESMRNGGGPACLRLRVVLNEKEAAEINPNFIFTEKLYNRLKEWIKKHYRDKLLPRELADPKLLNESREALQELTKILNIGSFYEFQR